MIEPTDKDIGRAVMWFCHDPIFYFGKLGGFKYGTIYLDIGQERYGFGGPKEGICVCRGTVTGQISQ